VPSDLDLTPAIKGDARGGGTARRSRSSRSGGSPDSPNLAVRGSNRAGLGLGGSTRDVESIWVLGRARAGSARAAQRQGRHWVAVVPRQRGPGPDPCWVLGLEASTRPGETTRVLSYRTSTIGRWIHGGGRSHGAPAGVISLKVDLRARIASAKEGGDHGGAHRGWDLPEVQCRGGRH
jgi:hypothetical protein